MYHLKQSLNEVMTWPARTRRDMWKRVIGQYELEKKSG